MAGEVKMKSLTERLRGYWDSNHIHIRSGLSPEAIQRFETQYNVVFPSDLREYLLVIDGMDGETDNELLEFLPLADVKPVPEELASFAGIPDYSSICDGLPDASKFFVFADYMIRSHVYAIRLRADSHASTPVIWICGPYWSEIAPSFSAFIENYLEDFERIRFPRNRSSMRGGYSQTERWLRLVAPRLGALSGRMLSTVARRVG
jgi:hypothetical protein